MIALGGCAAWVAVLAWLDWAHRPIPNALTVGLWAPALAWGGWHGTWPGFLVGLVVGHALWAGGAVGGAEAKGWPVLGAVTGVWGLLWIWGLAAALGGGWTWWSRRRVGPWWPAGAVALAVWVWWTGGR